MKRNDRSRFDTDGLREHAGAKVFARGLEYFQDGAVDLLSVEPNRVHAMVLGSADYKVVLSGTAGQVEGHCTCPAFHDWGFCKHMVATALAANAAGEAGDAEPVLTRIREHLTSKGKAALVDMVIALAEQHPDLMRRLDMASAIVSADDKTLEARLRKGIDAATRTGTYVDYGEAQAWRDGVEAALDAVGDLARNGRAPLALKLVERAIERIEGAIEAIDDLDGHIGALLDRACAIHLDACRAAKPDPVQLARDLFGREIRSGFQGFENAAAVYADVLGEPGLAEYRRLATVAWEKHSAQKGARTDQEILPAILTGILDFFAERDGDIDARIALRARHLPSQWSYLQLAEFCLSQGRRDEALRRAEEGLWVFEDERPDQRLVSFTARLLGEAGRDGDAKAVLWRAFERGPSLEGYKRLREHGDDAFGRAVACLGQQLRKPRSYQQCDLLVRILLHEKQFGDAWAAVRAHGASAELKVELAHASAQEYPREAIETYRAEIERLVMMGLYEPVAGLTGRLANLHSVAEHATFVAELKLRHRRRRNLMKVLP